MHRLVYTNLRKCTYKLFNEEQMHAPIEGFDAPLLRKEFLKAVDDASVKHELPTTSVKLLASFHRV